MAAAFCGNGNVHLALGTFFHRLRLRPLLDESIHSANDEVNAKGDDRKVDDRVKEKAVFDCDPGCGARGAFQSQRQIAEIHAPEQKSNGGHNNVVDKRGYNFSESGADDDPHGHIDCVSFDGKIPELF